jgi:hypothetical protein
MNGTGVRFRSTDKRNHLLEECGRTERDIEPPLSSALTEDIVAAMNARGVLNDTNFYRVKTVVEAAISFIYRHGFLNLLSTFRGAPHTLLHNYVEEW